MTIGIISDIHGNYEALKTVLAELDQMNVSEVICLGDVVGYYSQVNECCDELRKRQIRCVMGNHDWYMAGGGFCIRSKSVNDCLVYLRKVITAENVEWLRGFPLQLSIEGLHVVHGGWSDPLDEYLKWTETYFDKMPDTASHPAIRIFRRFAQPATRRIAIPAPWGSRETKTPERPSPTYDGEFTLHRVVYDISRCSI